MEKKMEKSANKTTNPMTVKSIKGLHLKGRRLKARVFNIGRKMRRNPSRADLIPSLEVVEMLLEEQAQLTELKRSFAAAHNQFEHDLYETLGILKHLHTIVMAQRAIAGG
jgi:hypothetical protein